MATSGKLSVRDVIDDLQRGLGDGPVMEKYALAPKQLMVIKQMWQQGRDPTAIGSTVRSSQTLRQRRALPRHFPFYEISVYEAEAPQCPGAINDIHREGLQVEKIDVLMYEVKDLIIPSQLHDAHADIKLKAQCRWSIINECGFCVAGFKIADISTHAAHELQKLIDNLTWCESAGPQR
jgi:hypothetical protein